MLKAVRITIKNRHKGNAHLLKYSPKNLTSVTGPITL